MKDHDERFWAALTTRLDAAKRAQRSEQEELAEAERFLQASEDQPLPPEMVEEVLDEVSGRREARQIATLPVGANLDRRWRMTRTAAAALVGSVLVLGGYAALEWTSERSAFSEDRRFTPSQLGYADAIQILGNDAETVERRMLASGVIKEAVLSVIDVLAANNESGREHLQRLKATLRGDVKPATPIPVDSEVLLDALEIAGDPDLPQLARKQALELLSGQGQIGIWTLAHADVLPEELPETVGADLAAIRSHLQR